MGFAALAMGLLAADPDDTAVRGNDHVLDETIS
jgi:hypothetical protein